MKLLAAALGLALALATLGLRAQDVAPVFRVRFELARAVAAPENFSIAELNTALLVETNRVRVAHGLPKLRLLAELAAAADDQAAFMALTLHLAHANWLPEQADVAERVKRRGLTEARVVAENVLTTGFAPAREPAPTCAEVATGIVAQWMDSPGHRANILNRQFTNLGCAARWATFVGGGGFYAAQVFAAR
jgi:uncharacterized protein YkwD